MMKAAVAHSLSTDATDAVREVADEVGAALGGAPHWVLLVHAARPELANVSTMWRARFPDCQIHAVTSCRGAMGPFGFAPDASVAAFAVHDELGDYAAAAATFGQAPDQDVRALLERVMERSGRPGEAPDLIFLSAAPGKEELILQVIEEELGDGVLVAGGSAADDHIGGLWGVADGDERSTDGLVLSVLYSSQPIHAAFTSGYAPTGTTGVITAAEGRRVLSIDGEPAAQRYACWAGGALLELLPEGGSVLARSSLRPLGRRVVPEHRGARYVLSHPENFYADGSMSLFTDIRVGDTVELMEGSIDSLIQRAARLIEHGLCSRGSDADTGGAIVVFCAGCRLAIGERMGEVARSIRQALGCPFIGLFTFGEQGRAGPAGNCHGNLMISVVKLDA